MQVGKMNRRITLRTNARTPDGMGGYTNTPTDAGPYWAHIEPLEGREMIEAMQTGMQRPHRITMRYRAGLIGSTLVIYEGRTFDVKSVVDPDEKHEQLVITADEVVVTT